MAIKAKQGKTKAASVVEAQTEDVQPAAMTEAAGETKSEILWRVRDVHQAGDEPRVHTPVLNYSYGLWSNKWTLMPKAHAAVFLRDKGFEVLDENKQKVATLSDAAMLRPGDAVPKLAMGQVVANLSELTDDALYARAATYPGGHELTDRVGRQDLLTFILVAERRRIEGIQAARARPKMATAADPDDPETVTSEDGTLDMAVDELENVFGGGGLTNERADAILREQRRTQPRAA